MKKVKIISILMIISLALFAMAACGGGGDAEEPAEADNEGTVIYDAEDEDAVSEDGGTGENSEAVSDETAADDSDSALISPEFKKTMDDYEAWFDHYCEVMKKYQENPSDIELLSEMTTLLSEETTMLEQMENMDQSEMNTAELAYYIDVTARIEKKLLEVSGY